MSSHKSGSGRGSLRYGVLVAVVTFVIAFALSAYSSVLVNKLEIWYLAFFLLALIISIGIVFDIIGVAVAAAEVAPLNARASRKLYGAAQALRLVKNADRAASICNDVVGDISGTLSGSLGAAIAFNLPLAFSAGFDWVTASLMAGIIAALTVGGKAICKTIAIAKADTIIYTVGKVIAFFHDIFSASFYKKLFKSRKK